MPKQIRPAATVHSAAERASRCVADRDSVRRGYMCASVRSDERADVDAERDRDSHRRHSAGLLV